MLMAPLEKLDRGVQEHILVFEGEFLMQGFDHVPVYRLAGVP